MAFRPNVNTTLSIDGVTYHFTEHPAAPGMPYGQTGRRATVYQLAAPDNTLQALKVFTQAFRVPRIAEGSNRLQPFANMPGLQVCIRSVLTPQRHANLVNQHPDLTYAVLMPWITGDTWQEFMLGAQPSTPEQSRILAQSLLHILTGMEAQHIAHCDLSGPNVILEGLSPSGTSRTTDDELVALVDVEDIYAPGLLQPEKLPGGTPGYAHNTAHAGLWSDDSDRFAGAVLIAEMLGWCDSRVRQLSYGEHYFDPDEMQQNCERFQILHVTLRETWGAPIADIFARAWYAPTLGDCPTLAEWSQVMGVPQQQPAIGKKLTPQERLLRSKIESAEALLDLGKTDEAISELEEAYQTDPNISSRPYARALMRRGTAHEKAGDMQSALDDYQAARKIATEAGMRDELAIIIADLSERLQHTVASPQQAPPATRVKSTKTAVAPTPTQRQSTPQQQDKGGKKWIWFIVPVALVFIAAIIFVGYQATAGPQANDAGNAPGSIAQNATDTPEADASDDADEEPTDEPTNEPDADEEPTDEPTNEPDADKEPTKRPTRERNDNEDAAEDSVEAKVAQTIEANNATSTAVAEQTAAAESTAAAIAAATETTVALEQQLIAEAQTRATLHLSGGFGESGAHYHSEVTGPLLDDGYHANIASIGGSRGLKPSHSEGTFWARDLDYGISGFSYVVGDMSVLRENTQFFLTGAQKKNVKPVNIAPEQYDPMYGYINNGAWDSSPNIIHAVYVYVAKTGDANFYRTNQQTVLELGQWIAALDSDGNGMPDRADVAPFGYYNSIQNSVMHTYALAKFYASFREIAELERFSGLSDGSIWDQRADSLRAGFHRPFTEGGYIVEGQPWPASWRVPGGTPSTTIETFGMFEAIHSGLVSPSTEEPYQSTYQALVQAMHEKLPQFLEGPIPMKLTLGGYDQGMMNPKAQGLWQLDASDPWIVGIAAPAYAAAGYTQDATTLIQAYAATAQQHSMQIPSLTAGASARYGAGSDGRRGLTWGSAAWFMAVYGGHYGLKMTPSELIVEPHPFEAVQGDAVQNLTYQGAVLQLSLDATQKTYTIQSDRSLMVVFRPMGTETMVQVNESDPVPQLRTIVQPNTPYVVVSSSPANNDNNKGY